LKLRDDDGELRGWVSIRRLHLAMSDMESEVSLTMEEGWDTLGKGCVDDVGRFCEQFLLVGYGWVAWKGSKSFKKVNLLGL
ncbi:hypothetical protein Tco_1544566, partial [Tanacetum coccineum]